MRIQFVVMDWAWSFQDTTCQFCVSKFIERQRQAYHNSQTMIHHDNYRALIERTGRQYIAVEGPVF